MEIHHRPDDPIRPDDILVRAGGGSVDALVDAAQRNAPDYDELVRRGVCRSPWTISVHVPRERHASKARLLASPPYNRYKPYLETTAASLLQLPYVQIVATTIVVPGVPISPMDQCHYDVAVEAADHDQLTERLAAVRRRFARHDNPRR